MLLSKIKQLLELVKESVDKLSPIIVKKPPSIANSSEVKFYETNQSKN